MTALENHALTKENVLHSPMVLFANANLGIKVCMFAVLSHFSIPFADNMFVIITSLLQYWILQWSKHKCHTYIVWLRVLKSVPYFKGKIWKLFESLFLRSLKMTRNKLQALIIFYEKLDEISFGKLFYCYGQTKRRALDFIRLKLKIHLLEFAQF